jgi:hypothetical protein
MIVKVHKTAEGRKVIALCDNALLGNCFEENGIRLDLSSDFYKGEERSEEGVLTLIEGAHILNVVGEKSINFVLKLGLIDKKNILNIKGVPHAQAIIEG